MNNTEGATTQEQTTNEKNESNNPQSTPLLDNKSTTNDANLAKDLDLKKMIDEWQNSHFDNSQIPQLVDDVNSDDKIRQHHGVIGLRKLLSKEANPPIQEIIDTKVTPRLLEFMKNDSEPQLQLNACWALTNIASGTTEQTKFVIDKGGIPSFIRLLSSQDPKIAEQATWAIGNIAGDSVPYRDMILKRGGLTTLLNLVITSSDSSIIKNGTWAIANLCRGKPAPEPKYVEPAISILSALINKENDTEVLTDAAWALSYISDIDGMVQPLVNIGTIPVLVKLLDSPVLTVLNPALRALGNIASGDEEQTNMLLQTPDFLSKLFKLVKHNKKVIRKEACWTISNITAGAPNQLEAVIGVKEYVDALIHIANEDSHDVKKEAAFTLANAINGGTPAQVSRLVELNVLDCFVTLLDNNDPSILLVALEGIERVLNVGASLSTAESAENPFAVSLEEKGALDKLEELQSHVSEEVYHKAVQILEKYFVTEEEDLQ